MTTECDKDFDPTISKALLEVERDLSLLSNSLVDGTPLPKISGEVRLKEMEVCKKQNFMATVLQKLLQHSKEMVLQKRVAEQEETISLLMNALDLLLEQ